MKAYFINIDPSKDRRQNMESAWSGEELVRVQAIDGLIWSDGTCDQYGRYCWRQETLDSLIKDGAIHPYYFKYYHLMPREYGCNRSHELAWELFLASGDAHCVVLEDDTEPCGAAVGRPLIDLLEVPTFGIDLLYLFSPGLPGDRLRLLPDGRVRAVRSLMGYWINRRAAELMVHAAHPAVYQTDWQIPFRLAEPLKTITGSHGLHPPEWPELPTLEIRGLFEPLVRHSPDAKTTTFTNTGEKPWIPKYMLP